MVVHYFMTVLSTRSLLQIPAQDRTTNDPSVCAWVADRAFTATQCGWSPASTVAALLTRCAVCLLSRTKGEHTTHATTTTDHPSHEKSVRLMQSIQMIRMTCFGWFLRVSRSESTISGGQQIWFFSSEYEFEQEDGADYLVGNW